MTGRYANEDLSINVLYINRNSLGCAQNFRGQNVTGEKRHTEKGHLEKISQEKVLPWQNDTGQNVPETKYHINITQLRQ